MKHIIKTASAPAPIGPYSQAVKAGNFLFISGQVCFEPVTGNLIQGSVKDETKQVMHNIDAILREAGMGFEDVVKTSIFLKNMDDFAEVNETYGSFFTENYPARETIEISRLPKDVKVEISMIAFKE